MKDLFDKLGDTLDAMFRYAIPGVAILIIDYLNGSLLLEVIYRINDLYFGSKNHLILLGIFAITIGIIGHAIHRLIVHEICMNILDRIGLPSHYSGDAFGDHRPTDRWIRYERSWHTCYRRAVSLRTRCHIWASYQASEKSDRILDAHATKALMLGIAG